MGGHFQNESSEQNRRTLNENPAKKNPVSTRFAYLLADTERPEDLPH